MQELLGRMDGDKKICTTSQKSQQGFLLQSNHLRSALAILRWRRYLIMTLRVLLIHGLTRSSSIQQQQNICDCISSASCPVTEKVHLICFTVTHIQQVIKQPNNTLQLKNLMSSERCTGHKDNGWVMIWPKEMMGNVYISVSRLLKKSKRIESQSCKTTGLWNIC